MIAGRAPTLLAGILALVLGGCGASRRPVSLPRVAQNQTPPPRSAPRTCRSRAIGLRLRPVLGDGRLDRRPVAGTDLTTLGLFSVTHRRDGELDDRRTAIGGSRATSVVGLARAAQDRGSRRARLHEFGPDKNRQFYSEPEAQTRWIEVLVELVDELGLDGINVDVERLPAEHVLDYGAFVGRLRRRCGRGCPMRRSRSRRRRTSSGRGWPRPRRRPARTASS